MKVETISRTNNIIYCYWGNLFYLGNTLQYPFGVLWIIILTAESFRKYLTTVKITYSSLYIYYELTYIYYFRYSDKSVILLTIKL